MTSSASLTGVFASHALELIEAGFAILPADGKRPLVSGWTEWSRGPSKQAVAGWARRHPDANIGYVAGRSGLIVIDADDSDAADRALELFGPTPGQNAIRVDAHHFASMSSEGILNSFADGLPMAERQLILAVQGQIYGPMFDEKLTHAAWKSKPSWLRVILVFSWESSRPRSDKNCSTRGLTPYSRRTSDVPVIMKSSA